MTPDQRAAALRLAETPDDGDCPDCHGSGTIRAMTSHLGPDDYEYDEQCPACAGSGSSSIKVAIESLPYSKHIVKGCAVIERAAVIAVVDAHASRKTELAAEPQAEPVAWRVRLGAPAGSMTHVYSESRRSLEYMQAPPEPLYAAPPQRKPLTDEQIDALRRLWPLIERATKGYVFTAAKAGEVAADMNAVRHGIKEAP